MDPISTLVLFLGLSEILAKQPVYQPENFYYYNADHKQTALPMTGRVYAYGSPALRTFLDQNKHNGAEVKSLRDDVVFICKNKQEVFDLLDKLRQDKIEAHPTILWEGMECIPSDSVVVSVKKHVTENTLKQRVKQNGKLVLQSVTKSGPYEYTLQFNKVSLPPNILVVGNMLAEDTAWFDNAHVVFRPIHPPVLATVSVERAASSPIYEERVLILEIKVYKPSIKILKDTIPVLGHNQWIPQPNGSEVWYEFGKPQHKVENTEYGYKVTMTQPFKFYTLQPVVIPPVPFMYEDGKQKHQMLTASCSYRNSSLLEGTDITDIQAISPVASLPLFTAEERPVSTDRFFGYPPLALCGVLMIVLSGLFLGVVSVAKLNNFRISILIRSWANRERAKVWNNLEGATFQLQAGDNWRSAYRQVSESLAVILSEFYNFKRPMSSHEFEDEKLRAIVGELELMYSASYEPDQRAVIDLTNNLKSFLGERVKFNV